MFYTLKNFLTGGFVETTAKSSDIDITMTSFMAVTSLLYLVKILLRWWGLYWISMTAAQCATGIGTFPSCRFAIRHLLSDICYLCQMHLTFLLSDRKFFIPLSLQTLDFLTSWVNRSLQIDFHTTCYWDFCYLRHLLSETFAIWDNYYLSW